MSSYIGLSDLAASWQLQRQNTSIKTALFDTGQQLTTNEKSVGEISRDGNIQRLFSFDRSLSLLDGYENAANAARVQMDAIQSSLGNVRDTAARVGLGVLAAVDTSDHVMSMTEARGAIPALESVVSMININVAGKSLFSGAATDRNALNSANQIQTDVDAIVAGSPDATTAIAAIDFYFNDPTGGFATTIYNGSLSNGPDVRVGDNESISMPVRADDPAIRETLRNLSIMASVANGAFPTSIADQQQMLRTAATDNLTTSDDLNKLREATGFSQERLEIAVSRNEAHKSGLMIGRVDMANVDPYETASRFQELQVQLEKMFTVTARLSQLTLTNYLR